MGKYEYVSEFSKFFDIENAGLIFIVALFNIRSKLILHISITWMSFNWRQSVYFIGQLKLQFIGKKANT